MKRYRSSIAFSALVLTIPILRAQEFRATITGRVLDTTDAVISGVRVEAKNVETNQVSSTTTGPAGNYTIPFLRPGTYAVSVQATGFKKFIREGLVLNVGQTLAVDMKLEVGAVTEQITVTAEAPLLETTKADRGTVIDQRRVTELPLNSRNPFMLAMFTAGVNFNGTWIYMRPFDNTAIDTWSINGSGNRQNEFLLDGAPNESDAGNNNIALVPPVDAVQEFKIQTNSYDAQYGKTGGGIINVSLKSGTNTFHGTIYEFARRNSWDANMFQNNAFGQPRSGHLLDQYGLQAEGPFYIPKLWDGRNKTFFMTAYERYRELTPNVMTLSVPEPEMRNGDFSKLADGQGRPITIYDPATGRDVNGQWVRDPFARNIIPQDRIHPIARKILGFMPAPNTSTPGLDYSRNNLYYGGDAPGSAAVDGFYNVVVKADQNIGDKHRIFYRHVNNYRFQDRNTNGLSRVPGEVGYSSHERINEADVLDWVGTLRPTLILNIRASYNTFQTLNTTAGNQGFDMTTLGFSGSLVSQLPYGAWFGNYSFSDYISLGGYFSGFTSNYFAVHPTITNVWRGHVMKAGMDMRWLQHSIQNTGNVFSFSSSRVFTQKDFSRADALSGNSIATWLLGTPSSGSVAYQVFPIFLFRYYAPYFQDDWKVTSRLTVNVGLRLDWNVPPNERFNRLNRAFDSQVTNPVNAMIDRAKFPDVPMLKGSLTFAAKDGAPRTAADLDKWNVQPRVGFAFRLTNKLVMRGGWGRYYVNPDNSYFQTNGFSQSTPFISSLDGNRTTIPNGLSNPYPNGIQIPPGSSLGALSFLGYGFSFVNAKFEIPYVNQFSFGFQYELPAHSKMELSYVGSRGNKLETSRAFNEVDLATRQKFDLMEGGNPAYANALLPNPFQGLAPFFGTTFYSGSTLSRAQLLRPFSEFGSITELTRNDGASWYNSMQVVVETRLRDLSLVGNYTLSKHIVREGFIDVQQNILQRSLFANDVPHHISLAAVYEFPFGKGKRFFSAPSGFFGRLISGWQGTLLFNYFSGTPWALPSNVLYLKEAKLDNINWAAPNVQGVRPCVSRWNDNGTITMQPFSANAGCTESNFLILPSYAPRLTPYYDGRLRLQSAPQTDISVNKMTQITEKMKVQFRAEVFNVTNTFMFHKLSFNNNPESANFGSLQPAAASYGQGNWPRQFQLAVKFIW